MRLINALRHSNGWQKNSNFNNYIGLWYEGINADNQHGAYFWINGDVQNYWYFDTQTDALNFIESNKSKPEYN